MQLDPLTWAYPELTPYQYASNDPITNIDIDGLEGAASNVAKAVEKFVWTQASFLEEIVINLPGKVASKSIFSGLKNVFQTGLTALAATTSALIDNTFGSNVTGYIANSGSIPHSQKENWNTAVTTTHYASILFGIGESIVGGGMVEGGMAATFATRGLSSEVSVPVAVIGAGMVLHGGLVTANASRNLSMGNGLIKSEGASGGGGSSETPKYKSLNQLNRDVQAGRSPKGIKRFDKGKGTKNLPEDEVTFDDNSSLYRSGKWRHNNGHKITNKQREYLKENGWTVPK